MTAFNLTSMGKAIAEDTQGSGPEFEVLTLIYEEGGPVDFDEICERNRWDDDKSSMVCRRLLSKGYIKEI